tara:strand:- start:150 stop:374 length:225 start_codon:yes stop_codon:yes gene_type:complete
LTKTQEKAELLAADFKISLKHMRAPIGVTGIWYKNDGSDQWMYYSPNWTEALKKLNKTKKPCKKKKAAPRRKRQ